MGSRCVEFLREFVVGVATPSDFARSFIMKILHNGEGGDVEQWLESRNNTFLFAIAHLSLNLLVFISCFLSLLLSLYA